MALPVSESKAAEVRLLRPSANIPSPGWVIRRILPKPTWYLVIFPVGCAGLVRALLRLGQQPVNTWLSCAVYAAAGVVGIVVAVLMERVENPELPRAISGIVGSVGFAISSFMGGTSHGTDFGGAGVLLLVYVLLAITKRSTWRKSGTPSVPVQRSGTSSIHRGSSRRRTPSRRSKI